MSVLVGDDLERGPGLLNISNAIVALHKEFYGRGPSRARSTLDRDMLVVVLEGGFSQAERTLTRSGRSRLVDESRQIMRSVTKERWVATVEQLLGREVRCFLSAVDPEQEIQIETFLLEPEAESQPG